MARKFKITEEQFKYAISEGVLNVDADVEGAGGDVNKAVETTKKEIQNAGVNPEKVNIKIPAQESRVITKKQLKENKLSYLKSKSKYYTVGDFLKTLGK